MNTPPRVAIIDGARTPFVKAQTRLRRQSSLDLAAHSVDGLLARQSLQPETIEELVAWLIEAGHAPAPRASKGS